MSTSNLPTLVIDDYNQLWSIDYNRGDVMQSSFTLEDLKGIEIPKISTIWLYLANCGYMPKTFETDRLRIHKRMQSL